MKSIFLVGEGANELGGRARSEPYIGDEPGALEALLRRIQPEGWKVGGAIVWRSIRKLQTNRSKEAETRNVLGAALMASERGCHAIAFVRDRDGDVGRSHAIEVGIAEAAQLFQNVAIAGGLAVETLEAWLLALAGQVGSESHRHPEKQTELLGLPPKDSRAIVRHIESAALDRIPADALSLRRWIECARQALVG